MRSVWIISPIIAIGLTTSAPAQQQVDQVTRQQIELLAADIRRDLEQTRRCGTRSFFHDGWRASHPWSRSSQCRVTKNRAALFE
jgi:hypothetical protein